ncbi:GPI-anchored surface protein, putative [Bodo saltans]|uniref:GPI-anchored surface protein, putative n=1 Tax=Bodo saltans TaxID=75058 RepID=A0A0S4JND9_BODSA|nr:GPI-anchored surface protein, putative [Bodo saltans]|eukprot:CUG91946.1 GPI-anchored surface protein, putative [Bodo saltans]
MCSKNFHFQIKQETRNHIIQGHQMFDCPDWRMLQASLLGGCKALKIHSLVPLERGQWMFELLCGARCLDPAVVALCRVVGCPSLSSEIVNSVDKFRSNPRYENFVKKILFSHLREHGHGTDRSDHLRARLDSAFDWLVHESFGGEAQADKSFATVFNLSETDFQIVAPFRKHFASELFQAIVNFFLRYYFDGVSPATISKTKKTFISFLPLRENRSWWCLSRCVAPFDLRLTPRIHVPELAWNIIHRGTSEFIPLLLNLFGFDNDSDRMANEQEATSAFQMMQAEIFSFHQKVVPSQSVQSLLMERPQATNWPFGRLRNPKMKFQHSLIESLVKKCPQLVSDVGCIHVRDFVVVQPN